MDDCAAAGIYFLTDTATTLIWTHQDHRWVVSQPVTGGDDEAADYIAAIRAALGVADLPVEILGSLRWAAAAQTATSYREGPVFLIGDAAHRVPPVGATGIGTAMQDAHNLIWKIAAVLRGEAGGALLDSYAAEREAIGRRNAAETGDAWTRMLNSARAPFTGRSLQQIDMGFQYRSSVIELDDSPDADPPGSDYAPSGTPGCRAPHLWIGAGDGRRSTIDLFDHAFVLLSGTSGQRWREAAPIVARELGVRLLSQAIDDPAWPRLYGVSPAGAVLVRPDGHIAWRRRSDPDAGEPQPSVQLATALTSAACVDLPVGA